MSRTLRIAVFLLTLSLVLSLGGCGVDQNPQTRSSDLDSLLPDSDMEGARIFMYDRSIVTAEINAKRVRKFESLDSTMAYDLKIDLFDDQGKVISQVVGDSGLIRESTEDLHMYGHVVVKTDNDSRLETDSLYFDPQTDSIYTDEFVRISRPGDTLTGWGLQADRALNGLRILRQVSGTISGEKKKDSTAVSQ
jgi:LPS export ABC transporter protein LptC